MAEQEWLRPAVPADAVSSVQQDPSRAGFELRPLSLGELLDRTFSLFRSRFWLFAGISMVSATVNTLHQAISLTAASRIAKHMVLTPAPGAKPTFDLHDLGAAQLAGWLMMLLFFLISAVTQAATAFALAEVYLRRDVSVKEALATVGKRWYRWIAIAFWQAGSAAWVPALLLVPGIVLIGLATRSGTVGLTVIGGILITLGVLGGMPVGVILYLRNALAIPAAVTEDLSIRAAMARSKVLSAGSKGRIFVVLLIAGCLYQVVGVLESPAAFLIVLAPNKQHSIARTISLALAFLGHTVVAPVALIGLALVYFDQRIRKEALDLELLLNDARGGSAPSPLGRMPEALPPEGYAPLG